MRKLEISISQSLEIPQSCSVDWVHFILSKKFGTLSDRYQTQITNLPLEQMESLSEALLDFTSITDLDCWLTEN